MDIAAISRNVEVLCVPASVIPAGQAAESRQVAQAVKTVNAAEMSGQDSELMFQMDPATERMVIQWVNPRTREVISQMPTEYLLRLAEDLKPSKKLAPFR
jgi:uncharacterized FlaG/YvyC family protein